MLVRVRRFAFAFATVLLALPAVPLPLHAQAPAGGDAPAAAVEGASAPAAAPAATSASVSAADGAATAPAMAPPTATASWAAWLPSDEALAIGMRVILAALLFLGGWVLSKLVSFVVYRLLCRTDLDDRLAASLGLTMLLTQKQRDENALERAAARVIHYVLMALVVVAVLQYGGLTQVAAPIQRLVETVMQGVPLVGKAVLILLAAYVAGVILRTILTAALTKAGVDRRFAELAGDPAPESAGMPPARFSENAGQVVFWLLMLVGLAGAFDALQIGAVADPLRNALDRLVGFLPAAGTAALLAGGGYLLARVARAVVRNALHAFGFDALAARVQLDKLTGKTSPSDVVGIVLMAFIVLQAGIAALNELGLETLSGPLTAMVAQFWALLPALAVSAFIVALGVVVGRILRGVIAPSLKNVGFDRLMASLGFGKLSERNGSPGDFSDLAGLIAQVGIVLVAIAQALQNLELATWAGYIDAFLVYAVTHVFVAMLIVGAGIAIGNHVRAIVQARRSGEEAELPPWVGEFARYAVLVFAFTMAARQLEVAEDFVLVSFALLFGSLCLAAALAFGLGSREVAGELVRSRVEQARAQFRTPRRARNGGAAAADGGSPTKE